MLILPTELSVSRLFEYLFSEWIFNFPSLEEEISIPLGEWCSEAALENFSYVISGPKLDLLSISSSHYKYLVVDTSFSEQLRNFLLTFLAVSGYSRFQTYLISMLFLPTLY